MGALSPRVPALALLAICAAALAAALAAQHLFGLRPCILCLYARVPYAVAGGLAVLILIRPPSARPALALAALAFLCGAGLAGYHAGVEQHWWAGTEGCQGGFGDARSIEELRARLARAPLRRCDEITWSILGVSITIFNLIGSLGAAAFALLARYRMTTESRP